MTSINQRVGFSSAPMYNMPTIEDEAPVQNAPSFKGADDNEMSEAIEKNTKAANTAANAALITSCATLLPLSVLAYKTHNLSKVAEAFQKDAKPALEKIQKAAGKVEGLADSAKPIVDDVHGITNAAKKGVENISGTVNEMTQLMKSDEVKNLINELTNKLKEADVKGLTDALKTDLSVSINKLTKSLEGKVEEIDPKVLNDFLAKISEFDTKGLSDSAKATLERLSNMKITVS